MMQEKTQGIKERIKKRSSDKRRKCKVENIGKEGNENKNK
jgi:hypothetical protein